MKKILLCIVMVSGPLYSALSYDGPLHHAAARGNVAEVERLLKMGVPIEVPGDCGETPLHEAARYGHLDVVNVLLAAGANLDAQGHCGGATPIYTAVCGAHSCLPIPEAVCQKYWNVVEKFLDHGVDVNYRGGSLLYVAVARRCLVTTGNLLVRGINSNGCSSQGITALQEAVAWGRPDVIKLLVDHGANPDIQSMRGFTALHFAVECDKGYMCQALLAAGANPEIKNDYGDTALEFARKDNKLSACMAILRYLKDFPRPVATPQPAAGAARALDKDDAAQQK